MWERLWGKRENGSKQDYELAQQELWKAHRDWELAQRRLDDAVGEDEVDYAVFMLEAAEKRYDMLLRRAKKLYAELAATQLSLADEAKRGTILGAWKEGKWWSKDG